MTAAAYHSEATAYRANGSYRVYRINQVGLNDYRLSWTTPSAKGWTASSVKYLDWNDAVQFVCRREKQEVVFHCVA